MPDVPRLLREYARLEKARSGGGLSARQLERWQALKQQLDGHFSRGAKPGQASQASRRASVRVPTRLKVGFESVGSFQSSIMTNVSRGGVFVKTAFPLQIGEKINLRIHIEEDGSSIEVPGHVVSSCVGGSFTTKRTGMGIAFDEMEEDLRAKLDALYERALQHQVLHGDEKKDA